MYIDILRTYIVSIKPIINFTVAKDICDYTEITLTMHAYRYVCMHFTFIGGISAG